jgi:hypothetical protein
MDHSPIILIESDSQRLKVAESFDFIKNNRGWIEEGKVDVILKGKLEDLVSLNVRIRSELQLDTCVIPEELVSEVLHDKSAVKNNIVTVCSGELVSLYC